MRDEYPSSSFVFAGLVMGVRNEFISAIKANQAPFGLDLTTDVIERLVDYFEIVQEHNLLLHLVAPCSAEEFAVRHILESLTLLNHFPKDARFADVGTGAGLPSIPCLIVREDLFAFLIDSKQKKAAFLKNALAKLGLSQRGRVIERQFEEVKENDFSYVTCRALDRFAGKLQRLLKWTGDKRFLFYGGPALEDALVDSTIEFRKELMPLSNQRFLFVGDELSAKSRKEVIS
jgi:16S rRNA (guanine527-N7)-methyltransferase